MKMFDSDIEMTEAAATKAEESRQRKVDTLVLKDAMKAGKIFYLLVAALEVIMIIGFFALKDSNATYIETGYAFLICYVLLLAVSIGGFVAVKVLDPEKDGQKIRIVQGCIIIFALLWSIVIVYLNPDRDYADVFSFVAMASAMPLACTIDFKAIGVMQLLGFIAIAFVYRDIPTFVSFCTNCGCFVLIAIAICHTYQRERLASHTRQVELEELTAKQVRISNTDALTGLLNRRAFNRQIAGIDNLPQRFDASVFVMDLNGLKIVNDTIGHSAGDEIIRGAADCITPVFEGRGNVYRIGGDEFAGIIVGDVDCEEVLKDIKASVANWNGELVGEISLALGYASRRDWPGLDTESLIRQADKMMYDNKAAHYAQSNNDRRKAR